MWDHLILVGRLLPYQLWSVGLRPEHFFACVRIDHARVLKVLFLFFQVLVNLSLLRKPFEHLPFLAPDSCQSNSCWLFTLLWKSLVYFIVGRSLRVGDICESWVSQIFSSINSWLLVCLLGLNVNFILNFFYCHLRDLGLFRHQSWLECALFVKAFRINMLLTEVTVFSIIIKCQEFCVVNRVCKILSLLLRFLRSI